MLSGCPGIQATGLAEKNPVGWENRTLQYCTALYRTEDSQPGLIRTLRHRSVRKNVPPASPPKRDDAHAHAHTVRFRVESRDRHETPSITTEQVFAARHRQYGGTVGVSGRRIPLNLPSPPHAAQADRSLKVPPYAWLRHLSILGSVFATSGGWPVLLFRLFSHHRPSMPSHPHRPRRPINVRSLSTARVFRTDRLNTAQPRSCGLEPSPTFGRLVITRGCDRVESYFSTDIRSKLLTARLNTSRVRTSFRPHQRPVHARNASKRRYPGFSKRP
jgi:hypothetical protein